MNIYVESMINTLAEKTDWLQHGITCFSVFLGAYLAYRFAKRQENQKDKKFRCEHYNILWNKTALSLTNLFVYKEVYLDRIMQAFEQNDFSQALQTSYIPDCDFSVDEKSYFLNSYNRCFLTELYFLSKIGSVTVEEIKSYYSNVFDVLYLSKHKKTIFRDEYEKLKAQFMFLYNEFEHLCVRAYFMNREFIKGFDRYFNVYSYEGTLEKFELEAKITERICNKEIFKDIQQRETEFDKYWQVDPNIYCHVCYLIRRFKYLFNFIAVFFKRPKICQACRCCKIKNKKSK